MESNSGIADPGRPTPPPDPLARPTACDAFRSALDESFLTGAEGATQSAERHAADCPACAAVLAVARELTCRDFVAFLDEYVEGSLAPERHAVFERHLELCDDCVRYLQSYRRTIELGRAALGDGPRPPAPAVPGELLDAILRSRRGALPGSGT